MTYIALFRGINVGGNHILPMRALTTLLEKLGAKNVKTYIQSGNVVFQHAAENGVQLADDISAAVKESHGFEPQVLLLNGTELERALAANPFPEAEAEPKTLHLYFLTVQPLSPDLQLLDKLKQNGEQFQLIDHVFYLYAPNGIGRSKLAEKVEKALGVAATARNWRTASKVLAMTK